MKNVNKILIVQTRPYVRHYVIGLNVNSTA